MTPPAFNEFFEQLHGYPPFPWQEAMASRLLENNAPSAVSAPTGLGKSAVLDCWIWALARDIASQGTARSVPIRAVFVVDRRTIVDDAYERALLIRKWLIAGETPAARSMADHLRDGGHALHSPLDAVRMRGGVSWRSRWLGQPDQPAVICGTVDQFGSRFLFRGYGTSARMRPIDAALVGTDVIAFLDEAHLSNGLVHSVRSAAYMESIAPSAVGRRTVIVPMTATPTAPGSDELSITSADEANPVAGRRIRATKHAELVTLEATKPRNAPDEVARSLADQARSRARDRQVVLVTCNTIALARRTHQLIAKEGETDAYLSIGRCREIDKEAARSEWWDRAKTGRRAHAGEAERGGLVVVATQTVEIGVDLDVDGLVTEAAPLDSLVQRFGRVNRAGELGRSQSAIVFHPHRSSGDGDLVYGATTEATWNWLTDREVTTEATTSAPPSIDMGIAAVRRRLQQTPSPRRSQMLAPLPPQPELDGRLLDLLARTDPTNVDWLGVDTFLHGVRRKQPTVSIVWRADLPTCPADEDDDRRFIDDAVSARLRIAPPSTVEAVDVPLSHALRFLSAAGADFHSEATLTDLDQVMQPLSEDTGTRRVTPFIDAWSVDGDGNARRLRHQSDLRPNQLIVVRSDAGGHDQFGWTGVAGDTVPDIADFADLADPGSVERDVRFRVDDDVLRSLGVDVGADSPLRAAGTRLRDLMSDLDTNEDDEISAAVTDLLNALSQSATGVRHETYLRRLIERLGKPSKWVAIGSRSKGAGTVEVVSMLSVGPDTDDGEEANRAAIPPTIVLRCGPAPAAIDVIDDDDRAGTSHTGVMVSLDQHLGAVGTRARAFADRLGLAPELAGAIELAGRLHDLGKADPRFQTILRGGDWLAAATSAHDATVALAKSSGLPRASSQRGLVPDEWRWPSGLRHEAISLALAKTIEVPDSFDRQLVEHLVASHHGWARPRFPAVEDPNRRRVAVQYGDVSAAATSDEVLAHDRIQEFRELCGRYGWWGLASMETILRLADMAVSEEGS